MSLEKAVVELASRCYRVSFCPSYEKQGTGPDDIMCTLTLFNAEARKYGRIKYRGFGATPSEALESALEATHDDAADVVDASLCARAIIKPATH